MKVPSIESLTEVATLYIGTNPRSLKRLLDSLSLINCINESMDEKGVQAESEKIHLKTDLELLVNFALVSIQIAYPPVYRFLNAHPDFEKWDDKIATQMNLKRLPKGAEERLNAIEEFDEEWEKVIYRLCEKDFYLKKNALRISRLLNKIKDHFEKSEEPIGDTISSIISLSSVTSLDEAPAKSAELHVSSFLKEIREKLINQVKKDFANEQANVSIQGAKVISNAYVKFSDKSWGRWIKLSVSQSNGLIKLHLDSDKWQCGRGTNNIADWYKVKGLLDRYKVIESKWKGLYDNDDRITKHQNDFGDFIKKKDGFYLKLGVTYSLPKIEDFKGEDETRKIAQVMVDILGVFGDLWKLRKSIENKA